MSNRQIIVDRNFLLNQLLGAVLHKVTPTNYTEVTTNAVAGQIIFYSGNDTTITLKSDQFYFHNGTAWVGLESVLNLLNGDTYISVAYNSTTGNWDITLDPSQIGHDEIDLSNDMGNNPHQVSLEDAADRSFAELADGSTDKTEKRIDSGGYVYGNILDGIKPDDAVTVSQLQQLGVGFNWTDPVRVATTGPITLDGGTTTQVDGVTLAAGDRVMVKDQGNPVTGDPENGIYVFATGAWVRATDMNAADEFLGRTALVLEGAINVGDAFSQTETITVYPVTENVKWVKISDATSNTYRAGKGLSTLLSAQYTFNVGEGHGINTRDDFTDVDPDDFDGKGLTVSVADSTGAPHVKMLEVDPDGTHLYIDSASKVSIADKGVTKAKVNTDVAGNGLTGGNSYVDASTGSIDPLSVKPHAPGTADSTIQPVHVDASGVGVNIDDVTIKTNTTGDLYVAKVSDPTQGAWARIRTIQVQTLAANTETEVTHNLANTHPIVQTYLPSTTPATSEMVDFRIRIKDSNTIMITSNVALSVLNVTIVG